MEKIEIKTNVSDVLYRKLETKANERRLTIEEYLNSIVTAWELCLFQSILN